MAHIDSARRIGRPTHVERWIDGVDADGNVIVVDVVLEHGRRAGLHTHRSQTSYARRLGNRSDRHATRRQLRSADPDSVELRQGRARSIWSAR